MEAALSDRWPLRWLQLCLAAGLHLALALGWLWLLWLDGDQQGRTWSDARLLLVAGGLAGVTVALFTWHPRRSLGWLPWAYPAWTLFGWLAWSIEPGWALAVFVGLSTLILVSLWCPLAAWAPRQPALLLLGLAVHVFVAKAALLVLLAVPVSPDAAQTGFLAAGLGACVVSWVCGYRVALERMLEGVVWPLYRIQVVGPGAGRIPIHGPLLIIGNHTNMLDPLFLGKIVPRRMFPMMTSKYYDLPVLSFLMRYVVETIRVEDNRRKRETPEIDEAIMRLRQGHCVMIFPEGRLKRHEEPVMNYFAQGVWHILKAVPETTIVATWTDGAWGAYLSYRHGPPGVGKPMDFWKRLTIVVADPMRLPAEVLETHQQTRRYLTDFVLGLRRFLPGGGEVAATSSSASPTEPQASDSDPDLATSQI
ncbi:MAG TPA: lysophospholipid acyltransferase family protein [Gemmatales bacterium]|nr:lysophospholipid acyltransferase family protein [Gemmatales bacterium]